MFGEIDKFKLIKTLHMVYIHQCPISSHNLMLLHVSYKVDLSKNHHPHQSKCCLVYD